MLRSPRSLAVTVLFAVAVCSPVSAQVPGSSRLLYNLYGQSEAYSGVAALRADSACTGAFLKPLAGSVPASAPAYVVSNGHCLGFLQTNEVILDRARTGPVTFRRFADTSDREEHFNIARVAYATMKGTDLAILELDASYGQVEARGLRPLEIQMEPAAPGERVVAVGVPVTGVPQDEQYLREADCTITGRTQLMEFHWTWYGFLRTDCADIKAGSSGSPLISSRTGRLVGIVNTTTQGAAHIGPGFACYLGVPCEIGRDNNPVTVAGATYAIPVAGLENCFAPTGRLDTTRGGCPLDRGRQLALSGYPIRVTQPVSDGRRVTWNTTVSGADFSHYRYKIVPEGTGDCRQAQGYGPVLRLAAANKIDDPLPDREAGVYLCVQGGNSPSVDASWQDLNHATFAHVRVDTSPSTVPPAVLLRDDGEEYRVDFRFIVPELSGYYFKMGPPGATDCESRQGYVPFRRIPLRIEKDEPLRFCAVGEDNAGNRTAPYEQLLDGVRIQRDGVVSPTDFQPSPLAPGGYATVFGVNFTPGEMSVALTGRSGVRRQAVVVHSGTDQVNFRVPPESEPGAATLTVTRGDQSASVSAAIEASSPSIFLASSAGGGALAYVRRVRPGGATSTEPAFNCAGGRCSQTPIYLAVGDRVTVEVYVTGLGGLAPEATISGLAVRVTASGPVNGMDGVDRVEFEVPYSIPVRSYVPVVVKAGANASRPVYLWLK